MLYRTRSGADLRTSLNLWLFQQQVDDILLEGDRAVGVATQVGIAFRGRTVVLTTGTFLSGLIHVGLQTIRPDAPVIRPR